MSFKLVSHHEGIGKKCGRESHTRSEWGPMIVGSVVLTYLCWPVALLLAGSAFEARLAQKKRLPSTVACST